MSNRDFHISEIYCMIHFSHSEARSIACVSVHNDVLDTTRATCFNGARINGGPTNQTYIMCLALAVGTTMYISALVLRVV